ncbi:MAG: 2-hydroxychromene-2-carboxylate isomerase [Burkholderiales bacterium]
MKTLDYFLSPMSPWTYFGHRRLDAIAHKAGVTINVKPVDYGKIFPLSGGLPLPKRAPQRQKYRMAELRRWRDFLGVPLVLEPKYFPYDSTLAALAIIAATERGQEAAMRLTGAILRGCWAEERNMADESELAAAIRAEGLDPTGLLASARTPATRARYEALTQEAIDLDVFGAPTYVYKGELFWGQDRLDFLERAFA